MKQRNVEKPIFQNFTNSNITITKDELFEILVFDWSCFGLITWISTIYNVDLRQKIFVTVSIFLCIFNTRQRYSTIYFFPPVYGRTISYNILYFTVIRIVPTHICYSELAKEFTACLHRTKAFSNEAFSALSLLLSSLSLLADLSRRWLSSLIFFFDVTKLFLLSAPFHRFLSRSHWQIRHQKQRRRITDLDTMINYRSQFSNQLILLHTKFIHNFTIISLSTIYEWSTFPEHTILFITLVVIIININQQYYEGHEITFMDNIKPKISINNYNTRLRITRGNSR